MPDAPASVVFTLARLVCAPLMWLLHLLNMLHSVTMLLTQASLQGYLNSQTINLVSFACMLCGCCTPRCMEDTLHLQLNCFEPVTYKPSITRMTCKTPRLLQLISHCVSCCCGLTHSHAVYLCQPFFVRRFQSGWWFLLETDHVLSSYFVMGYRAQ